MRFNCFIIYVLSLLFVPFQFCAEVPKSTERASEELLQISIDSLEAALESEVKKVTYEAAFDQIIEKPTLLFYRVNIEGRTLLVKESSSMYGEESSILIHTSIVGSDPSLFEFIDLDDVTFYEEMGDKRLRLYDSDYKLSEIRDVAFAPYSSLDYTIYTLNRSKEREHGEYWNNIIYTCNYSQSFVPIRKTSLYDKVFDSDIFLDITLSDERTDISKWTHNLSYETVETDETLSNGWSVSTITPFRFDSTVFVLYNSLEVYTGGAHEMFCTTVYNFDVNTGKLLKLSDIIDNDADEFDMILKEAVLREYDKEIGDESPSTFTIYPDGIGFTFSPSSLDEDSLEKDVFLSYDKLQNVLVRKLYPIENSEQVDK